MEITPFEVAETLSMITDQSLDIRTITLGINTRSCTDPDIDRLCTKLYDHLTHSAEHLVEVASQLEHEFGVPIANKRISVTPTAEICGALETEDLTLSPSRSTARPRRSASTSSAASPRSSRRA